MFNKRFVYNIFYTATNSNNACGVQTLPIINTNYKEKQPITLKTNKKNKMVIRSNLRYNSSDWEHRAGVPNIFCSTDWWLWFWLFLWEAGMVSHMQSKSQACANEASCSCLLLSVAWFPMGRGLVAGAGDPWHRVLWPQLANNNIFFVLN